MILGPLIVQKIHVADRSSQVWYICTDSWTPSSFSYASLKNQENADSGITFVQWDPPDLSAVAAALRI